MTQRSSSKKIQRHVNSKKIQYLAVTKRSSYQENFRKERSGLGADFEEYPVVDRKH